MTANNSDHKILHNDAALALALGVKVSTVRTWRAKRLIPFMKTGHRSISYSLPKVLEALESLTTPVKNETLES